MTLPINKFKLAKKIYREIYAAICDLSEKHGIFCVLPAFIELDGTIYQAYQCLDQEWFEHAKLGADQMLRISKGETKFYFKDDDNAPTN